VTDPVLDDAPLHGDPAGDGGEGTEGLPVERGRRDPGALERRTDDTALDAGRALASAREVRPDQARFAVLVADRSDAVTEPVDVSLERTTGVLVRLRQRRGDQVVEQGAVRRRAGEAGSGLLGGQAELLGEGGEGRRVDGGHRFVSVGVSVFGSA